MSDWVPYKSLSEFEDLVFAGYESAYREIIMSRELYENIRSLAYMPELCPGCSYDDFVLHTYRGVPVTVDDSLTVADGLLIETNAEYGMWTPPERSSS